MPQVFDAVQCASCSTFQIQARGHTKKRWACVLCGEKQSYIRLFATGSAKELRPKVQQLNMARDAAASEAAESAPPPPSYYEPPVDDELAAWQYSGGGDFGEAERRIDVTDGGAYTRDEFIEFYGSDEQWEAAPPAAPPALPQPPAAPPPRPPRIAENAGHDDGNQYVTEMPQRQRAAPKQSSNKRKHAIDDGGQAEQRQRTYGYGQRAYDDSGSERFAPAPARPAARDEDEMYMTAGRSEVVEEEVWQG